MTLHDASCLLNIVLILTVFVVLNIYAQLHKKIRKQDDIIKAIEKLVRKPGPPKKKKGGWF
jgi:hypothetical protein